MNIKPQPSGQLQKWLRRVVVVILVCVSISPAWDFYDTFQCELSQIAFDSKQWKAVENRSPDTSIRHRMIIDLCRNVIPGLSRNDVDELLGQDPYSDSADFAMWPIGPCWYGFAWSEVRVEYLGIDFDDTGHVEGWWVDGRECWKKLEPRYKRFGMRNPEAPRELQPR